MLLRLASASALSALAAVMLLGCGGETMADAPPAEAASGKIERVLLLDVAGLREDARVAYSEAHPASAFARLAAHATTYAHASGAGAAADAEYTDVFEAAS